MVPEPVEIVRNKTSVQSTQMYGHTYRKKRVDQKHIDMLTRLTQLLRNLEDDDATRTITYEPIRPFRLESAKLTNGLRCHSFHIERMPTRVRSGRQNADRGLIPTDVSK